MQALQAFETRPAPAREGRQDAPSPSGSGQRPRASPLPLTHVPSAANSQSWEDPLRTCRLCRTTATGQAARGWGGGGPQSARRWERLRSQRCGDLPGHRGRGCKPQSARKQTVTCVQSVYVDTSGGRSRGQRLYRGSTGSAGVRLGRHRRPASSVSSRLRTSVLCSPLRDGCIVRYQSVSFYENPFSNVGAPEPLLPGTGDRGRCSAR